MQIDQLHHDFYLADKRKLEAGGPLHGPGSAWGQGKSQASCPCPCPLQPQDQAVFPSSPEHLHSALPKRGEGSLDTWNINLGKIGEAKQSLEREAAIS